MNEKQNKRHAGAAVWVVCGESGAYSDQNHWIARAYTTEAAANAAVARLVAWHKERADAGIFRNRYDDGFEAESPPDDPQLSSKDWFADDASWFVERVDLIGDES